MRNMFLATGQHNTISLRFRRKRRTSEASDMMLDIPFWWILGAAAALGGLWVVRVFGANLNTDVFTAVLKKLAHEKNVTRALKLCAATGDAPLGKAIKAALLASISREDETNRPAGYRGNRPVSMDVVRGRIRSHYDAAFTLAARPVKNAFYLAIPAPFLFAFASFLVLAQPIINGAAVLVVGGIGLLFWLYVGWTHITIVSSKNAAFESLWTSLEALYHDRHAIKLEDKPLYRQPKPLAPEVKNPIITFEILEPGKPLRSMTLDQPIIKIGTHATAHVHLSAEGVARLHAVVEWADGKASIIDLGAAKTTTVNGEKITKHELVNGDVIGMGDAELVVR